MIKKRLEQELNFVTDCIEAKKCYISVIGNLITIIIFLNLFILLIIKNDDILGLLDACFIIMTFLVLCELVKDCVKNRYKLNLLESNKKVIETKLNRIDI